MVDVIEAFKTAIAATGMQPPIEVLADGQIHRFNPSGKRGDMAGYYVLYLDGVPAGKFGCWRDSSLTRTWCAKTARQLSIAERRTQAERIERMRKQRQDEQIRRQAAATRAAAAKFAATALTSIAHRYLAGKLVEVRGLRIDAGNNLLVPMRDTEGVLHNLQLIAPDGTKRFLPGGRVKGLYHGIGQLGDRLVIAEGYATGASIFECTGYAVAVAFNAGNLMAVAQALREKYPCITLVLAADDDWMTKGNPGLTAATEAARAVDGLLATPNFVGLPRGPKDTDFNDLHVLAGANAVRACFFDKEGL